MCTSAATSAVICGVTFNFDPGFMRHLDTITQFIKNLGEKNRRINCRRSAYCKFKKNTNFQTNCRRNIKKNS